MFTRQVKVMPSSLVALKAFAACIAAGTFIRRWEQGALACLLSTCARGSQEDAEARYDAEAHTAVVWLVLGVASFLMVGARGTLRRCFALIPLGGWIAYYASMDISAPHVGYVSMALLYVCAAPDEGDGGRVPRERGRVEWPASSDACSSARCGRLISFLRRQLDPMVEGASRGSVLLDVMRIFYIVAYLTSGGGKLLFTPAWQHGRAMEFLARAYLRQSVPAAVAATMAAGSVQLSASVLVIECAFPFIEGVAIFTVGEHRGPGGAHHRRLAILSVGSWLLSISMHVGILLLTPLTDVTAGVLLFHAALLHASWFRTRP